jgi:hypothetical protein
MFHMNPPFGPPGRGGGAAWVILADHFKITSWMPFLALPQLVIYVLPCLIPFLYAPSLGEKKKRKRGERGGKKKREKKGGELKWQFHILPII